MHRYLKKLVDERNALTALMAQVTDKAVAEDRDLTDAEAERVRGWQERAAQLDAECSEQSDILESTRAWARLQDKLATDDGASEPAGARTGVALAERGADPASWGELVTRAAEFQNYKGRGRSGDIDLPGIFETRAPIDSTFLTPPAYQFAPAPWTMTTPLLNAVNRVPVNTGTVEWVKWPGSYPLAGVVAEGALKPEATFAPTTETASLNTWAHWSAITRQALEDLPRIQSIVENVLRNGILRKVEADTAAALIADTDIPVTDNADLLAGIRIAIGEVQDAGYATPNAILLNPADFAALDIGVMTASNGTPSVNSQFWGVPALAVGAVPAGTSYVGEFKTGVTLFDRAKTAVYMTDSHSDNFIRNVLVILAEARGLPVVTEPLAIQKVTVAVGP